MHARFDFDQAFPGSVDIAPVVKGLEVGQRPFRIDGEEEGIASVEEGVEGKAEEVVVTRIEILFEAHHRQLVRLRVVTDGADVEVLIVVEDAHDGAFRSRIAGIRLGLVEA